MNQQPSLHHKPEESPAQPARRGHRGLATFGSLWLAGLVGFAVFAGCVGRAENEVVVYTALDREFSAPIFGAFHRHAEGQIQPVVKFDVESTKTVGLVNQIIAERDRPVADLFWNNEILHTIRLQRMGLLKPHDWRVESGYPEEMRAKDGTWCGFAARARVLLVNTERLKSPDDYPRSVEELADPKWKGRCAIARPLFGTTATHAAVIRQLKGEEASRAWFQAVAENAAVLSGNKSVAVAVATGQVDWGLTDTDDAIVEREQGRPVAIVFPDQATDQPGTLRIPNTLAILAGGPHPVAAGKLADFLLTPAIEDRLAMGNSAQLPISRAATHRPRVLPEQPVRWMRIDFEAAADHWETLAAELTELFP